MARPKKDPEIKRKVFMDAAKKLFFTDGYDATSIQDILLAVGNGTALSPSVFYYYFKSKDDLFEAVVQQYMKEHTDRIIQALDHPELTYQHKLCQVLQIQEQAILDFKKIDTYFDSTEMRSQYFNYVIDSQALSLLTEPLLRLVREAILAGDLIETPLLRQAGPRLTVQIFLSALLPLTHQGREEDGQHQSERYLPLIPLIVSQFFHIPALLQEDAK